MLLNDALALLGGMAVGALLRYFFHDFIVDCLNDFGAFVRDVVMPGRPRRRAYEAGLRDGRASSWRFHTDLLYCCMAYHAIARKRAEELNAKKDI